MELLLEIMPSQAAVTICSLRKGEARRGTHGRLAEPSVAAGAAPAWSLVGLRVWFAEVARQNRGTEVGTGSAPLHGCACPAVGAVMSPLTTALVSRLRGADA